MNKVILQGNIGKDLEIVNVGDNKVLKFPLAVKDRFKKDETDWFNCVVWNKGAEFIEKYFTKGSQIMIVGRIKIRKYTKDEVTRYSTEIIVEEQYFSGKKVEQGEKPQQGFVTVDDDDASGLPF